MNNSKERQLLFSITKDDLEISYYRSSGPGGQKVNKTSNAVRMLHRPSGVMTTSEEGRSQHRNKTMAFKKLTENKHFNAWLKMEIAKRSGLLDDVEEQVDNMMQEKYLKLEIQDEKGCWHEIKEEDEL